MSYELGSRGRQRRVRSGIRVKVAWHGGVVVAWRRGKARTARHAGRYGKGRLAGRQETGNWKLRKL